MRKIQISLIISLFALSLISLPAEAKTAPKSPKQTVIAGELSGIAPDKTMLNIKSANKRFDYTILLDSNTIFVARDGSIVTVDDFGFGDRIDARGIMDKSYTLQAKIVRDLTAWRVPVKQTTMTIKSVSADNNEIVASTDTKEWHINIKPQTVLMDEDRTTLSMDDFAAGDTIYVAGVWDQHSGVITASVIQQR